MNIYYQYKQTIMGIPFYYKHIIHKYNNVINHSTPPCNALYIDFNSIIHQCASKVTSDFPMSYTHEMIINEIIRTTNDMITKLSPDRFVFIGIDGVAPRAKLHQQRKRRYINAFMNERINEIYQRHMIQSHIKWDSNVITPGTDFMRLLNIALKDHYIHNDKVIISDSDEKGEGEQKIFDHIKTIPDNDFNIIINGLDADIIMLSLLSTKRIYIQRDDTSYININTLGKSISEYISNEVLLNTNINYIQDYVFLCFLLGNDFLPGIPYLKIREGAIDTLISIYRKYNTKNKEYIIQKNDDDMYVINFNMVKGILKDISDLESEYTKYAVKHYMSTSSLKNNGMSLHMYKKYPKNVQKYILDLESYPLKNRHPLVLSSKIADHTWNANYYKYLFGSCDINQTSLYSSCYIDGLVWIVNYYFNRKYDTHWYYKYSTPPLCNDIYKTLFAYTSHDLSKKFDMLLRDSLNIIVTPELQLLYVIPVKSLQCLPERIKHIVTDIECGCMHYYPIAYTLCTFMKTYLWECTPNLPDIDMTHLHSCYMKLIMKS